MAEEGKGETVRGGMLVDYPGHWMVSGERTDGDGYREWSVLRKPDGTYWQVVSTDIFPRSGGTMKVETGDQIADAKALAYFQGLYAQWLKKSAEKMSEK